MKSRSILFSALLLAANASFAADPVKVDIYLDGKFQLHATLAGPNSVYKFWREEDPDTVLELTLVSPEPIIVDMKETIKGQAEPNATGRAKLIGVGGTFAVSALKNNTFRHQYVLARPE